MADSKSLSLLKEVLAMVPEENQRLRNYLAALEQSLKDDSKEAERVCEQIAEYEEAYQKLTAPANRTGVFLNFVETPHPSSLRSQPSPTRGEGEIGPHASSSDKSGSQPSPTIQGEIALIAVGDSEFVVSVDPKLDSKELEAGVRVKVNDSYAIVGAMPPHPGGQVMKVSEVLGDDRLRVSQDAQGTVGRVLMRAEKIKKANIKLGDEVRIEPNFKVALEHYPQKEVQEYFYEEVPEINWDQIGGQEDAIALIRDTIEHPLLYPEIYERFEKKPIKGILLYGPPGCGKTLIGKATAHNLAKEYSKRQGKEVREYFMSVSGPKILNMWLGETERMVREIFQIAREKAKEGRLVFIFFDEAESVLRTRSSGRWLNISNTVVPQFCAEIDGLVSLENVVVMLTSNRPDYIDPAVLRPERIDRKVKIRRPDKDSSRDIFSIYLHGNIPLDPDALAAEGGDAEALRSCMVDSITSYLWRSNRETEFLRVFFRNGGNEVLHWKDLVSGALIKSVVDRAKDIAIKRAIAEPKVTHGIRMDDIKEAVKAEYRENEIFPKTDSQEDWLKLLDFEEDNVASVKPIRHGEGGARERVI